MGVLVQMLVEKRPGGAQQGEAEALGGGQQAGTPAAFSFEIKTVAHTGHLYIYCSVRVLEDSEFF